MSTVRSRSRHLRGSRFRPQLHAWLLVALALVLMAGCADGLADLARQTCQDTQALSPIGARTRLLQVVAGLPSRDELEPFLREMWRLCPEVVATLPREPIPLESVGITVAVSECSDAGAAGVITNTDQRVLDLTFDIVYTADDGSVVATDEGLEAMSLAPGASRSWRSSLGGAGPSHTHCEFILTDAYQGCC